MSAPASNVPDEESVPVRWPLPHSEFVWKAIAKFLVTPYPDVNDLTPGVAATVIALDLATCLEHLRECCSRGVPVEQILDQSQLLQRFNKGLLYLEEVLFTCGGQDILHKLNDPMGVVCQAGEDPVGSYTERLWLVAKTFYLHCLSLTDRNAYAAGISKKGPGPVLSSLLCFGMWDQIAGDGFAAELLQPVVGLRLAVKQEMYRAVESVQPPTPLELQNADGSDVSNPSETEVWNDAGAVPPATFPYGPLCGQKQQLAKWILSSSDFRTLDRQLAAGVFWGRRDQRIQFSVWFKTQERYLEAKRRELSYLEKQSRSAEPR